MVRCPGSAARQIRAESDWWARPGWFP